MKDMLKAIGVIIAIVFAVWLIGTSIENLICIYSITIEEVEERVDTNLFRFTILTAQFDSLNCCMARLDSMYTDQGTVSARLVHMTQTGGR